MNRKSKLRFAEWARKKNEEYAVNRDQYRRDHGFPDKIGRSIMPTFMKQFMDQFTKSK